ncbi:MAG: hypothetical protein H0T79_09165 [Deltaproteobacteria bacterium]|nr:hypothetical protein [Deltaproteobacteria bacterium]
MAAMRTLFVGLLVGGAVSVLAGTAAADTFSGFSGVDRPYLVNQDRVCKPLLIKDGAAVGMPKCEKQGADLVAKLSIKDPIRQSGAKASFAATASGRTLTVTRTSGTTLVAWDAPDPITKVLEVFGSQYDDRVAVTYNTRRAGKEVTDVIAFDLGQSQTAVQQPTVPTVPVQPTVPVVAADPKLDKAVAAARQAAKGKALVAWQAVLAIDPGNGEGHYRIAALHAAAKKPADALAAITALAGSKNPDAIEWLVEARFDAAFAALRSDPKFRAAIGLDRKPATPYERIMGFGGQWEQTGTACDKPEVRLTARRDRTFKLNIKIRCQGQGDDIPFKGTWHIDGDGIVLTVPTRGQKVTEKDQMGCRFEMKTDEDSLHCFVGRDLEFTVLPTRR